MMFWRHSEDHYALITVATLLRILSPLADNRIDLAPWLAGATWSCAFGLFAIAYGFVGQDPRDKND
jgi:uncharacterized protein involved in response to NO